MALVNLNIPDMTGDVKRDLVVLYDAFLMLRKELEFVLSNLDEDNVLRAGAVDAGGIVSKIQSDQIQSLSASKITAGNLSADIHYLGKVSASQIEDPEALDLTSFLGSITVQDNGQETAISCLGKPLVTIALDGDTLTVTEHWKGEEESGNGVL